MKRRMRHLKLTTTGTVFLDLFFGECYSDICVLVIHCFHRQLINHLGLSTSEVAKESGAGRHLYNWLTGQRTRQTNTLIAGIAAVRWFKQNKYRAPGRTGGGGGEGKQREKAIGKGKDGSGQDTIDSGGNGGSSSSGGSKGAVAHDPLSKEGAMDMRAKLIASAVKVVHGCLEATGISQQKMAKTLDVSSTSVGYFLAGQHIDRASVLVSRVAFGCVRCVGCGVDCVHCGGILKF